MIDVLVGVCSRVSFPMKILNVYIYFIQISFKAILVDPQMMQNVFLIKPQSGAEGNLKIS